LLCLLCLGRSPKKIGISSSLDTEWKIAANETSTSAVSEDVPERIVLKISSGTVVPDQKTPSKVVKHGSEGSGKRDKAHTKISASEGDLLPNQAVLPKKKSTEKDGAVAPGAKPQSKMKKRRNSKSDGFCSRDGSSTQMLAAVDKNADFSLNKPSEYKSTSSHKDGSVVPSQKSQLKAKYRESTKHQGHGAGDSSNAKDKAVKLPSIPLLDGKKLPDANAVGISGGQKSKVKKRISTDSKGHGTKNVSNTGDNKGGDFPWNLPERGKLSFDSDGTGLLTEKARSNMKKPVCSSGEVHNASFTAIQEIKSDDKTGDIPLTELAKCKNLSSDGQRNERLKFADSKPDSGLGRGSVPPPVSSKFRGGHDRGLKHFGSAGKTLAPPKSEKTNSGIKTTGKKATVSRRSDEYLQSKNKCHKRSLSDPHQTVHRQPKHGDGSAAAADRLSHPSHHPKTPPRRRYSGDCVEPQTAVDSGSGLQSEKPKSKGLSSGISGSVNRKDSDGSAPAADAHSHPSHHPKTPPRRRYSGDYVEPQTAVDSGSGLQSEKPKSKVLLSGISGSASRKYSDGSAPAADALSHPTEHPKTPPRRRHSSDYVEPQTAMDSGNGLRSEKSKCKVLSLGISGSANQKNSDGSALAGDALSHPSQHPKTPPRRRYSGDYVEAETAMYSGSGLQSEKPKSKGLSSGISGLANRNDSDGSAPAADAVRHPSQYPKTPTRQRRTDDDYLHHQTTSTAMDSSGGLQTEKLPKCKVPSSGVSSLANRGSQHPEAVHTQKHGGKSPKHPVKSVAKAEKPKSKVVSLADYKKRKSDPNSAAASVPGPTKISHGDSQIMTSSLAEQLISSCTETTKASGGVYERKKLVDSSGFMSDSAVAAGQDFSWSEIMKTFGNVSSFKSPGECSWPATQQHNGAAASYTGGGHMLSSRCDSRDDHFASKQMQNGNFSSNDGKCEPDCSESVAEMIRKDHSDNSVEAHSSDKATDFLEIVSGWLDSEVGRGYSSGDDDDKAKVQKDELDIGDKHELSPVMSSCEITTKPCETSKSDTAVDLGERLEDPDPVATIHKEELTHNNEKNGNAGGDTGLASLLSRSVDLDANVQPAPVSDQDPTGERGSNAGDFGESVHEFRTSESLPTSDWEIQELSVKTDTEEVETEPAFLSPASSKYASYS